MDALLHESDFCDYGLTQNRLAAPNPEVVFGDHLLVCQNFAREMRPSGLILLSKDSIRIFAKKIP